MQGTHTLEGVRSKNRCACVRETDSPRHTLQWKCVPRNKIKWLLLGFSFLSQVNLLYENKHNAIQRFVCILFVFWKIDLFPFFAKRKMFRLRIFPLVDSNLTIGDYSSRKSGSPHNCHLQIRPTLQGSSARCSEQPHSETLEAEIIYCAFKYEATISSQ